MAEMFRITTRRDVVSHVESRADLARRLLALESAAIASRPVWEGSRKGLDTLIERMFRSRKGLPETVMPAPHGTRVEQFVDGEWVPVEYEFVPAHLTLNGVTYSG